MDPILIAAVVGVLTFALGCVLGRYGLAPKRPSEEQNKVELELEFVRQERTTLSGSLSQANAQVFELQKRLAESLQDKHAQLNGLKESLKSEFEVIANRALGSATASFSEKSNETLGALLNPLKDNLTQFRSRVEETHKTDIKDRASLEEKIRQIAETNSTLREQAENLTKALKGEPQKRGRWGEIMLERILESSGLERGREFITQGEGLELRSPDGARQKPDVVVALPEGRFLIVDSKLALNSYDAFFAAKDEDEQAAASKALAKAFRQHVDSLESKQYQLNGQILSHDFVLMFVALEGAIALALQADPDILEHAWSARVIIVGPSTLLMTLKTVESVWRVEKQNKNAQDIATEAGALYDKLCGFVDDLQSIGASIEKTADTHQKALRKLATGNGNALKRAQRIKELGARTTKQFPALPFEADLIDGDDADRPSERSTSIDRTPALTS